MDCDDNDADLGAKAADGDCDGVVTADDCDDNDAASTTVATDGDCDGVLTDDDCDDSDDALLASAEDMDCDGVLADHDCDETDAESTTQDIDADCDGITLFADCNDEDNMSTSILLDGDCDGVLTALDCNDADATSTTIATDGDCDGVLTADDCDDANANVLSSAEDADCDGVPTIEDCDDNDSALAAADDQDCDGITNEEDNCPEHANADQHDPDGDGFGALCDHDEHDFAVVLFPSLRECKSNTDCPDHQICYYDDYQGDSYCYNVKTVDGEAMPHRDDCITDKFCLTRDPWGGPLHNSHDFTTYSDDYEYDEYDSNTTSFGDWAVGNAGIAAHYTGQGQYAGTYQFYEYVREFTDNSTHFLTDPFTSPYAEAWSDELLTWDGFVNAGQLVGMDLGLRIQTPPSCTSGEDGGAGECPFEFTCTPGFDGGSDQCPTPEYEYHNVVLTYWAQGYAPEEFDLRPDRRDRDANSNAPKGGRGYGRAKSVHFRKDGFATGNAKSDCITRSTCIARDSNKSLYNSAQEDAYGEGSIKGVTFALGATRYNKPENYTSFNAVHNNNPQSLVWSDKEQLPQVVSMHILEEDLYYDVVFLDYGNGGEGAPFEYIRSRALVPGCTIPGAVGYNPAANIPDNTCGMERFMKPSYADEGLPENQLCLSDNLCLTRGHAGPLYNAKGVQSQVLSMTRDDASFMINSDVGDGDTWASVDNLEDLFKTQDQAANVVSTTNSTPNYTTNGEYELRRLYFDCDPAEGLRVYVNGRRDTLNSAGDNIEGTGVYRYLPGATLADFDSAEELTAAVAVEPNDDWLHYNNDHINDNAGDKSGVIVFDGQWFRVTPGDGDIATIDFTVVAIEINDTSMTSDGDGGVAGAYTSCEAELNATALTRSSQEDHAAGRRWAKGATHEPVCTYEQMEREETIYCHHTEGLEHVDNSCDNRFDCNYPALEECNSAGRCVWKESYVRNNYSSLYESLDWPGPLMPTNHGFAMSLYDCEEDAFYDVRFLRWVSKHKGGGFEVAYTSVEPPHWYTTGDIRCADDLRQDYIDSDRDGVFDYEDQYGNADNCPDDENTDQADADADGVGDACDNCVEVANPGQEDADGNDVGNHCQV